MSSSSSSLLLSLELSDTKAVEFENAPLRVESRPLSAVHLSRHKWPGRGHPLSSHTPGGASRPTRSGRVGGLFLRWHVEFAVQIHRFCTGKEPGDNGLVRPNKLSSRTPRVTPRSASRPTRSFCFGNYYTLKFL